MKPSAAQEEKPPAAQAQPSAAQEAQPPNQEAKPPASSPLWDTFEPTLVPVSRPDHALDPHLGQTYGGYQLLRLIGTGSFSRVYLAEHVVQGTRAAVKLAEQTVMSAPALLQRFLGEARTAKAVQHPNIVRIFEISLHEGCQPYFVMEYLDGETLEAACARGPMKTEQISRIGLQLCSGLAAAHLAGIVHRDLKPENIFLIHDGERLVVKIVDFGIARREQLDEDEVRTVAGTVLGTPLYMSPEQASGLSVDGRSDIYSVGVILFQMATGRLPFQHDSLGEMFHAHANTPPPPPRSVNPTVHGELEAIILKCLEKKPDDRYRTMADLGRALAALLE
ncbi:MAG: serine/threonine protein kinase [Myxococcales bacterium]|nr:serine/threonine protein kinase [Myxococcales bacterium]